ncbi:MAG: hypothetical protein SPJ99_02780 [Candidatus Coprenecus sp.]|nr:hypothetical protein [Candidatus Coprenecus sp.]
MNLRNKINKDDKAGLYLTIIVHLVILIILLSYSIARQVIPDNSFVIDFSGEEQRERLLKEQQIKEEVAKELDRLLSMQAKDPVSSQIRNVATERSSANLKDDRNTDTKKLYEDAKELQKKLDRTRKSTQEQEDSDNTVTYTKKDKDSGEKYTGPSVLSWSLDGRKPISLPVPAYKCQESGEVYIIIIVNQKGYVVGTRINESLSSDNKCLREEALKAAGRSRFNTSLSASKQQTGEIVYSFIAQ